MTPCSTDPTVSRDEGLAPVVGQQTRWLILGSFPGQASLQARQYYGHPRNQFGRLLQAVWPDDPLPSGEDAYEARCRWLLSHRLGLWDVYASCVRPGSLDSAIRDAQRNDFRVLARQCPQLCLIGFNGAQSFRHAHEVLSDLGDLPVVRLPSTSPAHASQTFDDKLRAWRAAAEQAGLR